jgi:eukaryotic-like serine/threonine-protein kinase
MMAGALLAGRYELGERLGIGGMSTVVLAYDRRLERHVAVKLLAEHLAEDGQFVERFRREALAAARLVHPNIVQVFDFGLDEPTGRHYIVMEHIRGQSAAEILRDRGYLPVGEALGIVSHACRGLDYAHRNGVVHRDVKPGNLLRSEDGVVKLADFGIAKALSDESQITQVGSVLGTAAYLAPEQAAGEEAGPAADLYALGVVTYQLLSGRLPYDAQSLTELALKQQREVPALLHTLVADVPPELATAVQRALQLDPRDRYATADAMREALIDGARGIGQATLATSVAAPATASTRVNVPAASPRGPVEPRRPRAPREPRPAPAPLTSERRAAERRPPRRRRSALRRFLALVTLLLLVAVAGLAAVIVASNSSNAVQLRRVVYRDVSTSVDALKQLVQDNTR